MSNTRDVSLEPAREEEVAFVPNASMWLIFLVIEKALLETEVPECMLLSTETPPVVFKVKSSFMSFENNLGEGLVGFGVFTASGVGVRLIEEGGLHCSCVVSTIGCVYGEGIDTTM